MKQVTMDLSEDGLVSIRRVLKRAVATFGWRVITFEKYPISALGEAIMCVFELPPLDYSKHRAANFNSEKKIHKDVRPLLGYSISFSGGTIHGRFNNIRPGVFHMNCQYICPDSRLLLSKTVPKAMPEDVTMELFRSIPASFYLVFNNPNKEYVREGRDPRKKGVGEKCGSCTVSTGAAGPCFVRQARTGVIKTMPKKYKRKVGIEVT